MKNNIPLDGTNVNDANTDKDALSLLIMRQAFIDATEGFEGNHKETDEITNSEVIEEME